jgi:hypothetical protein
MDPLRDRLEHGLAGRYRLERELGQGGMAFHSGMTPDLIHAPVKSSEEETIWPNRDRHEHSSRPARWF